MSEHSAAVSVLLRLPASTLTDLGRALDGGTLRHGFSFQSILSFAGEQANAVEQALRVFLAAGFTLKTLGIFCESLGTTLAERDAAERSITLVLSGPDVAGTPVVDTKTTVLSLFEEATEEVLITSYVFHEAAEFFAKLAEKHDKNPKFHVTFLVDLTHRKSIHQALPLIAQSFAADFRTKHWPGQRVPDLWHDPRHFDVADSVRGILHAKTVIVDRKIAFITSANFTEAGQSRNIEAGVLIRQPRTATRLHDYFSGLIATNVLRRIHC